MNNTKYAFTLVELIVVITILAILGTISFFAYTGFVKSSKDSVIISNIKNIEKTLTIFKLDNGLYPQPDNSIAVTYSGIEVWNQGIFGKNIFQNIKRMNSLPVNNITGKLFTYSITADKSQFQINTVLNGLANNGIINNSYAGDYNEYITGTYNGKFVKIQTGSTIFLLATPSIIASDLIDTDLVNIINNRKIKYNNFSNFSYIPNSDIEIFSGTIDDLKNNFDKKFNTFIKLQKVYTGSILSNDFKELFSDSLKNSLLKVNYLNNYLNNYFNMNIKLATNPIFDGFGIGFGGASSFPFAGSITNPIVYIESYDFIFNKNLINNGYYQNIANFSSNKNNFSFLQSKLNNSKFVTYWVTPGWQESWYNINNIQKIMDSGKIPVFSYWYFGDNLSVFPTQTKIDNYFIDNKRFNTFLKKLKGYKLILMEPEFNKDSVMATIGNQHKFANIISKSIDIIKQGNKNTFFTLTMIDKGSKKESELYCPNYINCSFGDQKVWDNTEIIFNDLLGKIDFMSFQEMVSQFSRNPKNPGTWTVPIPISYSISDVGIRNLSKRIQNFSLYLKNKYNKPVFLPYIGVMTDSWNDINNNNIIDSGEIVKDGYLSEANNFYYTFSKGYKEMKLNGLFGYSIMELFDNPTHNDPGYKYFLNNEAKLGIISTSAITGKPKGDLIFKGSGTSTGSIIENIFNGLNLIY